MGIAVYKLHDYCAKAVKGRQPWRNGIEKVIHLRSPITQNQKSAKPNINQTTLLDARSGHVTCLQNAIIDIYIRDTARVRRTVAPAKTKSLCTGDCSAIDFNSGDAAGIQTPPQVTGSVIHTALFNDQRCRSVVANRHPPARRGQGSAIDNTKHIILCGISAIAHDQVHANPGIGQDALRSRLIH